MGKRKNGSVIGENRDGRDVCCAVRCGTHALIPGWSDDHIGVDQDDVFVESGIEGCVARTDETLVFLEPQDNDVVRELGIVFF